jgi:hypothetical protein
VSNWSISRNYKEIRNSIKISVTPGIHVNFLGGDALQEAVEWNPRPGVGGGHA